MIADKLLSRLDGVKELGPNRWKARCPAHQDRSPSLLVSERPDGSVGIHCFAECQTLDVISAVGLDWSDLFPPKADHIQPSKPRYNAHEVLQCLDDELTVVCVICSDILQKKPISPEDKDRLFIACRRISSAREMTRGLKQYKPEFRFLKSISRKTTGAFDQFKA